MAARTTTCYSNAESSLNFYCFKVTNWAILYCINEFVWIWTKRNQNLTSFVCKNQNFYDAKLMHCTMCSCVVRPTQGTTVYMHILYSVSDRRYTCAVLLYSSTCRFYISRSHGQLLAMPYFFTCVSFVLYLKFIKYQNILWLICYLSSNDSLNLKSPPAIDIRCETTRHIID